MAETFKDLVAIDSVSKKESAIAVELVKIFGSLGAATLIDRAGEKIGSNTGNLVVKFKGTIKAPPIFFNAHLDTVEPGENINIKFKDGMFTSDGVTVLGADDKSAIAILLEVIRVIRENSLAHGPLEFVFTVCEEIGLLGAKKFDPNLIKARYGYALDASDIEGIITRAPAVNRIEFKIYGQDAHAGVEPEKGINAISIAGKAIAGLDLGRIDNETTCNIGKINGGVATNIVPNLVLVKGEVRSHSLGKLKKTTNAVIKSFQDAVVNYKRDNLINDCPDNGLPCLEYNVVNDFPGTRIPEDHYLVKLACKAALNLKRKLAVQTTGGGSDANIFFSKGIITGILGTGMRDMHTLREHISLADMVKTTELVLEIIKIHSTKVSGD